MKKLIRKEGVYLNVKNISITYFNLYIFKIVTNSEDFVTKRFDILGPFYCEIKIITR